MCCVDRDPLGEFCLPEEAPPVLSTAPPPGRLLLLTDRHAGRPGALGCLPQCVHKEELHSVTSGVGGWGGASHFIAQPEEKASSLQQIQHQSKGESGQMV